MLKKIKLVAADYLRYQPLVGTVVSDLIGLRDRLSSERSPNQIARSLFALTAAARLRGREHWSASLETRIREKLARWSPDGFDWDAFFPNARPRLIQKSIILKKPGPAGERGVLFVAFEDNWLRLLRYADLAKLASDYDLVLSPTWSPPHDVPFLLAVKLWPGTLCTILSNLDDEPVFHRLAPNVVTVRLLASSWVQPEIFAPRPDVQKQHDIAILANFAIYKRHFALFRAMSQMRRRPRLLVIGHQLQGRTAETVMEEAKMFGVAENVTIAKGLPDEEMIRALQASRVSVIFSMGEGSCVAVTESLFADVPVGLLEGANVGSRAFINPQTGCFLRSGHIPEDLEQFIERSATYSPRAWMLEHGVSYKASSRILNDALKRVALEQGRPWTAGIAPMHWRPHPTFESAEDREAMRDAYARFEADYGIPIEPDGGRGIGAPSPGRPQTAEPGS